MARIDARTGKPFTDPKLDLMQAVEDTLLTRYGTRLRRPEYGSLVTDWGTPIEEIIPSIYDALQDVIGVEEIAIENTPPYLTILINGATFVQYSALETPAIALRWGGAALRWGGDDLRW